MLKFDPYDPTFFDDPYPTYARMRSEAPVYRHRDPDYFMLSRHQDITAAMSNPRTFSSARGVLIDTDSSQLPVNLMNMDPPRHDELRNILTRALTESQIAALEDRFRELVVSQIEEFRSRGECEIVGDFARALPSMVIAEVMEIDLADRDDFLRWNHAVNAGAEFVGDGALRAYEELDTYFKRVIEDRKMKQTTDLVSRVFRAQQTDESLSDEEVLGFCTLLLVAGQHATINLIANAVIELSRHPDQFELLRNRPELLREGAVDELLRFCAPVQGLARTTTRDVTLHGVTMPEGSQVLMLFASGNRDAEHFRDPDTLDLTRPPNKTHLAFGHGIHFCLGTAVARLEGRVALEELVARLGEWEVDESSIVRNQLIPGRGVASTNIRFKASA